MDILYVLNPSKKDIWAASNEDSSKGTGFENAYCAD